MNFAKEKKLFNRGFSLIVGLDEAGRGALAGPIVAGAVVFSKQLLLPKAKKILAFSSRIKDSKILTSRQRSELFSLIADNFIWSIGKVSAREIDRFGIVKANKLAMQRAVYNLSVVPDYLLVDYIADIGFKIPTQGIVKGDSNIFSIAAASIVAKVARDRLMDDYHKKYNFWNFDKHKGYGTGLHIRCLQKYGVSPLHRQSFSPVRRILQNIQK